MHLLLKVSCSLMLILLLLEVSDAGQSTLQAYPVVLGKFSVFLYFPCGNLFQLYNNQIILVLVPGDGGSQIEGKIDKPSVVHYVCSKVVLYSLLIVDLFLMLCKSKILFLYM